MTIEAQMREQLKSMMANAELPQNFHEPVLQIAMGAYGLGRVDALSSLPRMTEEDISVPKNLDGGWHLIGANYTRTVEMNDWKSLRENKTVPIAKLPHIVKEQN